jgi:hypothetical protein
LPGRAGCRRRSAAADATAPGIDPEASPSLLPRYRHDPAWTNDRAVLPAVRTEVPHSGTDAARHKARKLAATLHRELETSRGETGLNLLADVAH